MKKWIFLLILSSIITAGSYLHGEELYCDFLTGFRNISRHCSDSGTIVIDNRTDSTIAETYPFDIRQKDFTYQIRLQNASATVPANSAAGFGIILSYANPHDYYAIRLNAENTAPFDDIADKQFLNMKVYRMKNGAKTTYQDFRIEQGVAPDNGFNSVKIEKRDSILSIKIGDKYLRTVAKLPIQIWPDTCHIGYFAESGCRIVIKRICYRDYASPDTLLSTHWSQAKLDSIFSQSTDPNEGYWHYLDRNTDERFLRLGGKYQIAIVNCNDSYQLLYLSGTTLHPLIWQPFMLKGMLFATPFQNHYNLIWYDAEKHAIKDESYATFSGNILTLHFPIKKSEIRFYKSQ